MTFQGREQNMVSCSHRNSLRAMSYWKELRPMTDRMKTALFLLFSLGAACCGFGGAPAAVAKSASAWRAQHEQEIIGQLAELAAIPNLASDLPNIERNATALRALCEKRGLRVQLLRLDGVPPLVVADLRVPNAQRTIAFYAHYDGQPVDSARWKSDPWKPVMRDTDGREIDWRKAKALDPEWRLYARSAGDDKASIIAMLAALDALRHVGAAPSVNLRFVFEGEEEAGSPHLAAYLEKYREALQSDAWILCDGPVHQSRRSELFFGARGIADLELTVYGPGKGLHDGHYGNWAANPAAMLTHLIASMRDENGRITIDGFAEKVQPPTQPERDALAKIPNVEEELRREFQIGSVEGGGKSLNELLMAPALNVRGMEAGHVGAEASNTIPTEARASIDFRLVPDLTPESIKPLVEQHLHARGHEILREAATGATAVVAGVSPAISGEPQPTRLPLQGRSQHARVVRVHWGAGYPAARTALDLPLSREVAGIMTAAGHDPVLLPTSGGSIPMFLFQQPERTPVIGLPIANHDDNQHAADENMRLQNLWDGIDIFAALFSELAPQ